MFEQPGTHLARHRGTQSRLQILVQHAGGTGEQRGHRQQDEDQDQQIDLTLNDRVIEQRTERLALTELQAEFDRHQQTDPQQGHAMRAQQGRQRRRKTHHPVEAPCRVAAGGGCRGCVSRHRLPAGRLRRGCLSGH